MEQIYLWGAGQLADDILTALDYTMPEYKHNNQFQIKGIIDNDPAKQHQFFHGFQLVLPGEALQNGFSKLIILNDAEYQIRKQAENGYHIPKEKLEGRWYLFQLLLQLKYNGTQDREIQSVLDYWKEQPISLFNHFLPPVTQYHEVIWDPQLNLPYILFQTIDEKTTRMYYPRSYSFSIRDDIQVVEDILYEQKPTSPHLYTYDGHTVKEGDILLDGGVCEGNFALRYVTIASKIYLAECDPVWREPLFHTFKPYQDKIVYCDRPLSNRDGYYSATIDTLIPEKLDFLKLDIEGAEVQAIEGAEKTLRNNSLHCSVCCYHKKEDEALLKKKFQQFGYHTSVSNGYMAFLWDRDLWWNIGFRRGVVFAEK